MKKVGLILGLTLLTGCASYTPAGAKVKLVDTSELAIAKKECKQLGVAAALGSRGDASIGLFNDAGKMGANIVVTKNQLEPAGNDLLGLPLFISKGTAFLCPENVKAKLINAEGL